MLSLCLALHIPMLVSLKSCSHMTDFFAQVNSSHPLVNYMKNMPKLKRKSSKISCLSETSNDITHSEVIETKKHK